MGGTDQKFNLLMGRQLQRTYNLGKEQAIIMMPHVYWFSYHYKENKSIQTYNIHSKCATLSFLILSCIAYYYMFLLVHVLHLYHNWCGYLTQQHPWLITLVVCTCLLSNKCVNTSSIKKPGNITMLTCNSPVNDTLQSPESNNADYI